MHTAHRSCIPVCIMYWLLFLLGTISPQCLHIIISHLGLMIVDSQNNKRKKFPNLLQNLEEIIRILHKNSHTTDAFNCVMSHNEEAKKSKQT